MVIAPDSGASKRKKKVRGPYSDPAIYEAYVQRCIDERNVPRETPVAVSVLKEELIATVESRPQHGLFDRPVLLDELSILVRLQAVEKAKRALSAIAARIRQIQKQLKQLEDEQEFEEVITILLMEP